MTHEEALEFAKGQIEVFGGTMNEFLKVTIKCIDKQIPKKLEDFKTRDNEWIGFTCPRCAAFYSLYGKFIDSNYCPNCGQRVYVEGDEE